MNVIMCKTVNPLNHINKTFYDLANMVLRLKSDFDIYNPSIVLSGNVTDLEGFNYFKFTDLHRFYYVRDTEIINNKLLKFNLVCDVLETYKPDILNSTAILKRKLKSDDVQTIDILTSNGYDLEKVYSNVEAVEEPFNVMAVIGVSNG